MLRVRNGEGRGLLWRRRRRRCGGPLRMRWARDGRGGTGFGALRGLGRGLGIGGRSEVVDALLQPGYGFFVVGDDLAGLRVAGELFNALLVGLNELAQ